MTRYAVLLTRTARDAIRTHARFLALDQHAPLDAERWLERILVCVASLERWPRRCGLAEEDAYVDCEVRRMVIGSHLLLYTVLEEDRRVVVLGLRHGSRAPHEDHVGDPSDLP